MNSNFSEMLYSLEIIDISQQGKGVAKIPLSLYDSEINSNALLQEKKMVVFVEPYEDSLVVGDVVDVLIKKKKKNYIDAIAIRIVRSCNRIVSSCPYANKCGGCIFHYSSRETELSQKERWVKNTLQKFAKISSEDIDNIFSDIYTDGEIRGYRSRGRFLPIFSGGKITGFGMVCRNNGLINIDACLLMDEEINKALKVINEKIKFIVNNPSNKSNKKIESQTIEINNKVDLIRLNNENTVGLTIFEVKKLISSLSLENIIAFLNRDNHLVIRKKYIGSESKAKLNENLVYNDINDVSGNNNLIDNMQIKNIYSANNIENNINNDGINDFKNICADNFKIHQINEINQINQINEISTYNTNKSIDSTDIYNNFLGNLIKVKKDGFFQVNHVVAEKMISDAIELVSSCLPGENSARILELYCGAAAISVPLLKSINFSNYLGIEYSDDAVKMARENALLAGLEMDKVSFLSGDAGFVIEYLGGISDFDILITDPPRAGMDNKVLEYISSSQIKNIIYISCDPATFSRDISYLMEKGNFELKHIRPYDMFPRTGHVEVIVGIQRKDI